MNAGAVILCAGASSRMGRPKALLPSGLPPPRDTFLSTIVHTARAALRGRVVVVAAAPHMEQIQSCHRDLQCEFARNPDPSLGMASSVQIGVRALLGDGLCGALIWPVDAPWVAVGTCAALIACGDRFAVPTYAGRGGHPLWAGASTFSSILGLAPGQSLRTLVSRPFGRNEGSLLSPERLIRLPVADPAVSCDIDTPEDHKSALAAPWLRDPLSL